MSAPEPSVAWTRRLGLGERTWLEGIVTAPPGLFPGSLYLADRVPGDAVAGPGLRVYLPYVDFSPIAEGSVVRVTGTTASFRGEKELQLAHASDLVVLATGEPLLPLAVEVADLGEAHEGRLVTFEADILLVDGDSLYVTDAALPGSQIVRVAVLRSLGWPRPAAQASEHWRVTGIVGQMARASPWNGGYRVLVRYPSDLARLRAAAPRVDAVGAGE